MTGDGSVNRNAPILCCTAVILAKIALRHGEETPYTAVIADEFHHYRDRGMAWQIPLLTAPAGGVDVGLHPPGTPNSAGNFLVVASYNVVS